MEDPYLSSLDLFFAKLKPLRYKKGEIILRAGETPPGVLYLKRGFVRLYSISKQGEELTLIIFKSGDFFPIMWAINNTPNNYFVEAATFCEICRAPRTEFLAFVKDNCDVLFELTSRMLVRFAGILSRMEYLVFGNAYAKVASILAICAERFGKGGQGGILIEVPLTHNDIASLVGVTRETASVEIKKIERKGLIARRGRLVFVKNLRALKRESLLDVLES